MQIAIHGHYEDAWHNEQTYIVLGVAHCIAHALLNGRGERMEYSMVEHDSYLVGPTGPRDRCDTLCRVTQSPWKD